MFDGVVWLNALIQRDPFGTCVQGRKLLAGGLSTKAVVIGEATRSFWFIGVRPRICSIVRVMLTWV